MADADLIRALPKWVLVLFVVLFIGFMGASPFIGTFKLFGYEFGFILRGASKPESSVEPSTTEYTVTGRVEKEDKKRVYDVMVSTRYPPYLVPDSGELVDLRISKGPDGKFPTLAFIHGDYATQAIDLNDEAFVLKDKGTLNIKRPVVMRPIPQ